MAKKTAASNPAGEVAVSAGTFVLHVQEDFVDSLGTFVSLYNFGYDVYFQNSVSRPGSLPPVRELKT